MSAACCGAAASRRRGIVRRALGFVRWALPGAALALVPKCPACVAAYIALWTGLGISITAAAYLRTSLIVVATAALVALSLLQLHRVFRNLGIGKV